MARRRDTMTRAVKQYEKSTGQNVPTRYTTNGNNRRDAGNRNKGRRGVRARARLQRINDRMANGTYTQPSGGTGTNS